MMRDVIEFRRAGVGCLWGDELEPPAGAWRAARGHTGGGQGARICTSRVPPAAPIPIITGPSRARSGPTQARPARPRALPSSESRRPTAAVSTRRAGRRPVS